VRQPEESLFAEVAPSFAHQPRPDLTAMLYNSTSIVQPNGLFGANALKDSGEDTKQRGKGVFDDEDDEPVAKQPVQTKPQPVAEPKKGGIFGDLSDEEEDFSTIRKTGGFSKKEETKKAVVKGLLESDDSEKNDGDFVPVKKTAAKAAPTAASKAVLFGESEDEDDFMKPKKTAAPAQPVKPAA